MKFASVCSGIEAATVALTPLGFKPVFYSEIDKPTNRFLATKYPETPNYGDLRDFKNWPEHKIDLLIGGTPCQSFSLRGKRGGVEDERGNLTYSFFGVVEKYRPKFVVWENTCGVLSSNRGRDFGSFLGALVELRYDVAYRVLDSQHFGVPQRRRRVYVVGSFGEGSARKVLFQPGGMYGVAAATRRTPETIAKCVIAGTGRRFDSETETFVVDNVGVRRLMPIECERLQGFEDNYTLIQIPGRKNLTSDSWRYKAVGNSMCVPVIKWIGKQILSVKD